MEESHRSLFAVRVVRPYQTEEEFLREESFALTASSIVLVGAGPRTDGVILRFEVVLESGAIMLRGEGRVAGHVATPGGEGLLLRFTRLDPRSKALVDRASPRAVNESSVAVSASMPPPPAAPSSRPASVPPFPGRDAAEAPVAAGPPEPPCASPAESAPAESAPAESATLESAGGAPPEGAGLASSPPAPTPQSAPAGDTPSAAPRAPGVRSTRPDDERSAALDRLRARLRGAGAAERLAELGIDVPAAKR